MELNKRDEYVLNILETVAGIDVALKGKEFANDKLNEAKSIAIEENKSIEFIGALSDMQERLI